MEDRDLPRFVRDRLRELERSAALAKHDFEAARSELDSAQRQMFDARLRARGQAGPPGHEQAEALRSRADEHQRRVTELEQRVRDLGHSHNGAVSAVTQCRALLSELPQGARLEDADLPQPPDLETARAAAEALRDQMRALVLAPVAEEDLRRLVERHAADLAGTVDIRAMVDRGGRLSVSVGQLDPLALLCAAQPDRAAELLMASARRANIGRPGDPLTQEERQLRLDELKERIDAAERAEEAALQAEVRAGRPAARRVVDARHILRVRVVLGSGRRSAA